MDGGLSLGLPVKDDAKIHATMLNYGGISERSQDPSATGCGGSPQSVKSQADAIDPEDDLSQQQFSTQAAVGISTRRPQGAGHQSGRAETEQNDASKRHRILQVLKARGRVRQYSDKSERRLGSALTSETVSEQAPRKTFDPPHRIVRDAQGESRSIPSEPPPPKGAITPSTHISLDDSAGIAANPTEEPRFNKRATSIPLARAPPLQAGPKQSSDQVRPRTGESSSRQLRDTPSLPRSEPRHFERWRRDALAGRYVPIYAQKIPRAQAELLESDSSWQPARIGRPQRPGQIPLPMLEQITKAVDAAPPSIGSPDSSPEPPNILMATDNPNDKPLPDHRDRESSSDSDTSPVEWSPSPQSQRRRNELPPNSPLPNFRQELQALNPDQRPKVGIEAVSQQLSSSIISAVESEDDKLAVVPLGRQTNPALIQRQSKHVLGENSYPTPSAGESSILSSSVEVAEEALGSSDLQIPSTRDAVPAASCPKIVQVERTPFPGRGLHFSRGSAATIAHRAFLASLDNGDPTPSFIPGTYPNMSEVKRPRTAPTRSLRHPEPPSRIPFKGPSLLPPEAEEISVEDPTNSHQDDRAEISSSTDREIVRQNSTRLQISQGSEIHDEPQRPVRQPFDSRATDTEEIRHDETQFAHGVHIQQEDDACSEPSGSVGRGPQQQTVSSGLAATKKRKRTESLNSAIARKRHQGTLATTHLDPDHSDSPEKEKGEHRIDHQPPSKPTRQQSTSSSLDGPESGSEVARYVSKRHRESGSADRLTRNSDTPITRVSTYSGAGVGEIKPRARDSVSTAPARIGSDKNDLFTTYRTAYPDYKGDKRQFVQSCVLIGNTLAQDPGAFHQFLFDDAIYHHFHSYLESYWPREGILLPVALPFHEFYRQNIQVPSHLGGVVSIAAIQTFTNCQPSRDSATSEKQAYVRYSAGPSSVIAADGPMREDRVSAPQDMLVLEHVDTEEEPEENHMSSIEQWRQTATGPPSPELGTPNIDRSISSITPVDVSVPDVEMSLPKKRDERQAPNRQRDASSIRPEVWSRTPVLDSSKEKGTPQTRRRPRPSASPFVKPSRPVQKDEARKTLASSSPSHQKSDRRSVKDATPFQMFATHYAALPEERRSQPPTSKGHVVATDVFSWRF